MRIENIFSLGELFERVQMEQVFPDGKTFVDCSPNEAFSSIQERYNLEKNSEGFDLRAFVHHHFTLPKEYATNYVSDPGMPIIQHLESLWDVLTRQPEASTNSLIPLPFPYIVPGGRFREIYYWDSYFTMLGLQVSNRVDMIQNMIDNFSFLIDRFGYIPNGNRTYYLGRSQPPFYAGMVNLLRAEKGDDVLIKYLPQLKKEHDFWMMGKEEISTKILFSHRVARLPDASVLNHYWDESDTPRPEAFGQEIKLAEGVADKAKLFRNLRAAAESGWDFSSRWFKDKNDFSTIHTTDIIPVDLNCLLLNLEQTIAEGYELAGDKSSSQKYQTLAHERIQAINAYCWNEEKGFYFDYDYIENRQTDNFTLAAGFALFFEIASKEQAALVAKNLQEKFLSKGGLITTTETTDQQWDAPNGWAPLQWIAIQGLIKYGYIELAEDVATRWLTINKEVYEHTGKMMEKYNVVTTGSKAGGGEYPAQDGFGWTNGVYLSLDKWLRTLKNSR